MTKHGFRPHVRRHRNHSANHAIMGLYITVGIVAVVFALALLRCRFRRSRSAASGRYSAVEPTHPQRLAVRESQQKETKIAGNIERLRGALRRQTQKLQHQRDETTLLTAREHAVADNAVERNADWQATMERGRHIYGDAWDQSAEEGGMPLRELMQMNKGELQAAQRDARAALSAPTSTHAQMRAPRPHRAAIKEYNNRLIGQAHKGRCAQPEPDQRQQQLAPPLPPEAAAMPSPTAAATIHTLNAQMLARGNSIARRNDSLFSQAHAREQHAQHDAIDRQNDQLLSARGGTGMGGNFDSVRLQAPALRESASTVSAVAAAAGSGRFRSSRGAAFAGAQTAAAPTSRGGHGDIVASDARFVDGAAAGLGTGPFQSTRARADAPRVATAAIADRFASSRAVAPGKQR